MTQDHQLKNLWVKILEHLYQTSGKWFTARRTRDTELPVKFNPAYKRKSKQYYDRPTNQLPEVPVESTVRICDKEKGTWPLKAKVLGNANTPRSLFVESEQGSTLRRNRQDLLITNEKFAPEPDTEDIRDEPTRVSGNDANHDEIQQSKFTNNDWRECRTKYDPGRCFNEQEQLLQKFAIIQASKSIWI